MLEDGINPDCCNSEGLTALHQTSIEGALKIAKILLAKGANVNARDNDWWTPTHAAAACGNWRIVNLLITNE